MTDDTNSKVTPTTDGLVMGMDSELMQLENLELLIEQVKQSNTQMNLMLQGLEKLKQNVSL